MTAAVGVLVGAAAGGAIGVAAQRHHDVEAFRAHPVVTAVPSPSPSPSPVPTVVVVTVHPSPHTAKPRPPTPSPSHRAGTPPGGLLVRCPAPPLRGVYHPQRLRVLGRCRTVVGFVVAVRHEEDGDYHVNVKLAPRFRRLLTRNNLTIQHGALVTEIMPGQTYPIPNVGDRIAVFGTWVYDTDHGWNEIHPIWAIRYPSGRVVRSLPVVPPRYEPDASGGSGGGGSNSGGGSVGTTCTPGYSPCLPRGPSDYDCAGGGGDGPAYTKPGVVCRVSGSDPYALDSDGDGLGCE